MVEVTTSFVVKGIPVKMIQTVEEEYSIATNQYCVHIPEQWIHVAKEAIVKWEER